MKANFDSIINENKPIIVDFQALWCVPCKKQSPIIEELAEELGTKVRIIEIDFDQNNELARRYQIKGVPALMIFRNGELKYKKAGVRTKPQIINA